MKEKTYEIILEILTIYEITKQEWQQIKNYIDIKFDVDMNNIETLKEKIIKDLISNNLTIECYKANIELLKVILEYEKRLDNDNI